MRARSRLLLSLLLVTSIAQAADTQRNPTVVMSALADRIYVLGETGGDAAAMAAAEAKAADDIRQYIASGATDGLLATQPGKQSPLLTAAYMGYPNVLAALLTSNLVKAHINDADDLGMTPWIAANFSIRQSLWTCNPAVIGNPYKLVPMLVTQPYYTANSMPPYKKARELLENAGAARDMAKAKEVWLTNCTKAPPEARTSVAAATDLQKTVQSLGAADLTALLVKLQNKAHAP